MTERVVALLGAVAIGVVWIAVGIVLALLAAFPSETTPNAPATSISVAFYAPMLGSVMLIGSPIAYLCGCVVGGRIGLVGAVLCAGAWIVAVISIASYF
jgi:hypothetical protein